mgnify:FL=1
MSCPICLAADEEVLLQTEKLRVIAVHDEPNAPAFCRVIWQQHVAEMTDLPPADRSELMQMVCKVEQAMRQVLNPTKINLASLGNMVPHLHWHVIARFEDDACFPAPILAPAKRETQPDLPVDWVAQVKNILLQAA